MCTSSSGKGTLTGPKTLTVQTTFKGCEEPETNVSCQSGKKTGVIKTSNLEGTLVLASSSAVEPPVVAVSMPGLGAYKCGGTEYNLNSRVKLRQGIAEVTPTDEPVSVITVTYAEGEEPEIGRGRQVLQLVEGVGPCVHFGVTSGSGPEEPAWVVASIQ